MDKSYVGMEVCMYCGKETGAIVMDNRMMNTLDKKVVTSPEPCSDCAKTNRANEQCFITEVSSNGSLTGSFVLVDFKDINKDVEYNEVFLCNESDFREMFKEK